LLARLNPTGRLIVPPLRNRMVDLPVLMTTFLRRAFAQRVHREVLEEYASAQGLSPGLAVDLAFGKPGESHGFVFALSTGSVRALRSHAWPGNLRELDHLMVTAAVLTLSDALMAAEAGRDALENPRWLPIPAKLIGDLLSETGTPPPTTDRPAHPPATTLHGYMSAIESEILQSLFRETKGDFLAMAKHLLLGSPAKNARRVRLRFNQLGLKVKGGGRPL